eukprot:6378651-Pyramimonas_sp.AAC.1
MRQLLGRLRHLHVPVNRAGVELQLHGVARGEVPALLDRRPRLRYYMRSRDVVDHFAGGSNGALVGHDHLAANSGKEARA